MRETALEIFEGEHGMVWRAHPDEADWVRRNVAEDPDAVEHLPGAVVVKRNPVRTVVKVPRENGPPSYIKRFSVGGLLDRLKYLVVPSRAEAEWRASHGMRAAGIPAAEVTAVAEARFTGLLQDAMLVVRGIPDVMELVPYMFHRFPGKGPWTGGDAGARRDLLRRLGELVRSMHDAGFTHPDLHGGNLLLQWKEEPAPITIIDLHSVKAMTVVAPGTREDDLSKLLHSMITATSYADRARVVRAYEGQEGALSGGRVLRRVEARIAAMEETRIRSRTRVSKLLKRTGRFDVRRGSRGRMVFLRRWGAEPFDAALRSHVAAAAGDEGAGQVLKRGGRSTVTRVAVDGPDGRVPIVVKETRVRGTLDIVKNAVRRTRAVRSWMGGNGLWHRHFDVAEPLAVRVEGHWPRRRESFLFLEALPEEDRLDRLALRRWGDGPLDAAASREKRDLIERFGLYVGTLHATGIYHADLKAVNVFLREKHGAPSFCLIDYDRVDFGHGTVGLRRRIKNLAQLAASVGTYITNADRMRFYAAYARKVRGAWSERRRVADAVAEACARKIVVVREPIE